MKNHQISFHYNEYNSVAELPLSIQNLLKESEKAAGKAYAPYSNFHVGAAIALSNGQVVLGNNQENAAYPSGLCAERVAMFFAMSQSNDTSIMVERIAITAMKDNVVLNQAFPCGACRQSMVEYELRAEKNIEIWMNGQNSIIQIPSVQSILPMAFGPNQLKGS